MIINYGGSRKNMDNTKAISSAFEMALRVLLLLSKVKNRSITIMQICEVDFIAVYAADFGLLDENLHGTELTDSANF